MSLSEFWTLLNSVDAARVRDLATQHTWLALLLCFASGILTSLTPCIYPMIPITINIFGRAAREEESSGAFNPNTFKLALVYVAGMCVTYSAMGILAGLTGSLFGRLLQSPWMLGLLTALFLFLALAQFGFFKLELPASWQTKIAGQGHANSGFGIFLMGLFSGLIVSPCVGPVIAGILAFVVESSDALTGMLYFLSFSLGLGVLFLVIGGFSGVLSRLPRSGAWMLRINRVLASLMLVAAAYYGVLLAKQMNWVGDSTSASSTSGPTWMSDEGAALREAERRNVPMIVDFTAEWCEACHVIEKTVFQNPEVARRLDDFVLLRFDVTRESEENSSKLRQYGVFGLPSVVFRARGGKEIYVEPRINGVLEPKEFLTLIDALP